MHQFAQGFDLCFKDTVCAGISDHDSCQVGAVLLTLGLQVGHVDVALRITCCNHNLHAHHLRTGGVGAVCTGGNETNIAMPLTLGFVKSFDHQQACIFAL